ncbi:MAG: glycosyl transferase family 1 [Rhodocyclales bacterium]|nr:glycosyl transferase family 1 [Rhodocyclales bacterium]
MRLRVLHFYKTAFPDSMGGTEQVINQLAKGCNDYGITTDVLSLTSERAAGSIELDGYTAHRVRRQLQIASTDFSLAAFRSFAKLAAKADVIHYHFPWPFMDVVHFATRVNKPSIVTYHSDIIRQKHLLKLYRPLRQWFLASVDHIVATSPNYLATSDVLTKFADKVSVIPIGIDKTAYPPASAQRLRYWRERLGKQFFLFVGVLRYYKGLHLLLEAAQGNAYPVAIVGAGPIERELKARARQLGLKNIYFLGFLPEEDKIALLTLCLAVVFPSHLRSEAFGISLLEGAMFGKPMISSEIGTGTSYINIANETGLVVPPGNPDALRCAMRFLWEQPGQAAAMGRVAEARYWQHFTAAKMVKPYAALYENLAQRATKA